MILNKTILNKTEKFMDENPWSIEFDPRVNFMDIKILWAPKVNWFREISEWDKKRKTAKDIFEEAYGEAEVQWHLIFTKAKNLGESSDGSNHWVPLIG